MKGAHWGSGPSGPGFGPYWHILEAAAAQHYQEKHTARMDGISDFHRPDANITDGGLQTRRCSNSTTKTEATNFSKLR